MAHGAGRVDAELERRQLLQGGARQAAGDSGLAGPAHRGGRRSRPAQSARRIELLGSGRDSRSVAGRRLSSCRDAAGPLGDAVRVRVGVWAVQVRALSARESAASGRICDRRRRPTLQKSRDCESATALARDLINTPANDMSPEALAQAADRGRASLWRATSGRSSATTCSRNGSRPFTLSGRAAAVAPRLVDIEWGDPSHPKVGIVGKGVCFDSGGLDIKPGASMLLMKKDMGGAAVALALAQLVMDAKLPVRLRLLLPAVENAISANAYRPGDVLGTRKGLTVEIGNTDAEGRVILCDALALADEEKPDLLIDTGDTDRCGARRARSGASRAVHARRYDWRASWSISPHNRAIRSGACRCGARTTTSCRARSRTSTTFRTRRSPERSSARCSCSGSSLKRAAGRISICMRWNGKERPGRPVGAEPQTVRALYAFLKHRYAR